MGKIESRTIYILFLNILMMMIIMMMMSKDLVEY